MEQAPFASPRARFRMERASSGFQLSAMELALLAGILVACAAGAYWTYAKSTDLNASPAAGVASAYIPVFRTSLTTTIATNGSVQATQQVNLSFDSSGEIKEISVKVGDQVTTGQKLARLDDTQLQASLRSAQSNFASAAARLDAAIHPSAASVASAQASVTTAQNQVNSAEQALSDLRALPKASDVATAQQGVLGAQTALQNAQDAVTKADNDLDKAQDNLNAAENELDSTYESLKTARSSSLTAYNNCTLASKPSFPSVPSKGSPAGLAPVLTSTQCDAGSLTAYNSGYVVYGSARTAYNAAGNSASSAESAVTAAQGTLSSGNLQRSIESAQLGLQTALQKQTDTLAGATPTQIAQAAGALDTAKASLLTAQERYSELLNPTPETVLPLQSSVDQAASTLETARQNADKATITAPFDGVISAVNGTVGNQASAGTGTGAAANSGVITLLNPRLIRVDASVDQTAVSKLKAGQTARVTFDALSGFTYSATVSSVGLTPTTASGVVTYLVSFAIDTSALPATTPVPSPGMTAQVTVTTQQESNALVVPSRSISGTGAASSVTVKGADGAEERRRVTTGITNGTLTQVTEGLTEGEEVLYTIAATTSGTTTPNQQQFQIPGGQGGGGGPIFIPGGGGGP